MTKLSKSIPDYDKMDDAQFKRVCEKDQAEEHAKRFNENERLIKQNQMLREYVKVLEELWIGEVLKT